MRFDVCREARDLLEAIAGRNRHQNRLVESAANHFGLTRSDQGAKAIEILRVRSLDPFEKRPRIVEAQADGRMPREHFDEGEVRIAVGAFEYVVEIPDRLVGVNQKYKLKFPHRRPSGTQ